MPQEDMFKAMADYHEELTKAGVLLDANGLQPSSKGWRIKYSGGKRTVVDGPFTEAKELVAGYTIIQVKSREEALEWTRRFPKPHHEDCEIEIRQMFELDDFGASEQVESIPRDGCRGEEVVASPLAAHAKISFGRVDLARLCPKCKQSWPLPPGGRELAPNPNHQET